MLPAVAISLTVAAFTGAGLFNAIGTAATRRDFVRWGFPEWWCRVTGGLEIASGVLIAVPVTRDASLIFGAVIIAAAMLAVLRQRECRHLPQLGFFVILLGLTSVIS